MIILVLILFFNMQVTHSKEAHMIDGGKQRWHKCRFPHSWDNKIERILDAGEVKYNHT